MSHLACKCLELQLIWIYSPPANKGITYPLQCLPCSSDLLLICSSAIMFTEIGYFSLPKIRRQYRTHRQGNRCTSGFWIVIISSSTKTTITRIRKISTASQKTPSLNPSVAWPQVYAWGWMVVTIIALWHVVGLFRVCSASRPKASGIGPGLLVTPQRVEKLDLKLWNSFDTFSSYQAGKVWGYWISPSHTTPRPTFVAALHNHYISSPHLSPPFMGGVNFNQFCHYF